MTRAKTPPKADDSTVHDARRILRGGSSIFMEVGGKKDVIKGEIFSPSDAKELDVRSYFSDKLRIYHGGNGVAHQTIGAPLPAAPAKGGKPALSYTPQREISWTQEDIVGLKLTHADKRKPEKSIMGGTANSAINSAGISEKPLSPWAHTVPDHLNFLDRKDPAKRLPGYVGANQVHTVFESAAKIYASKHGSIKVTRELGEPVAADNPVPSELKLGFVLDGKNKTHHHFIHNQPYFTNAGGRNGDEKAIVKFLEDQKRLIDQGLPTLADKVTSDHRSRRGDDFSKSRYGYQSVAANYLAARFSGLSVTAPEGRQDVPEASQSPQTGSERSVSPAAAEPGVGHASDRGRKRSGDALLDDRSAERARSRNGALGR